MFEWLFKTNNLGLVSIVNCLMLNNGNVVNMVYRLQYNFIYF